jgi:hypothetical protein
MQQRVSLNSWTAAVYVREQVTICICVEMDFPVMSIAGGTIPTLVDKLTRTNKNLGLDGVLAEI